MQQRTSNLLYAYWNRARNGRLAPYRYEIEPAKIAGLLPETLIAECAGLSDYRIRLAGTRICEQFGRELRGTGLLECWKPMEREALESLLQTVVSDGAAAVVRFSAAKEEGRRASFEMVLMPLIHTGRSVNRILGCITAIDPPFWLGTAVLDSYELETSELVWPDGKPAFLSGEAGADGTPSALAVPNAQIAGDERRRFRVFQGGLSDSSG